MSLGVTVDQLVKAIFFLLIRDTWDVKRLTQLYVRDTVQMYGISTTTVSNRNKRFQVHFLASTLENLKNPLHFDSPYQPAMKGPNAKEN